jgi:DNA-binding NtrC family response regulator
LNRELLESELFGHEKGAFTGASRRKRGRFELAHKGTIFLDEVDDIPLDLQVKLLRVIQERTFERVGGEQSYKIDVRLICATKEDLKEMVSEGKFREDLYYRLNVVKIALPPLKERGEDIMILAQRFLERFSKEKNKSVKTMAHDVQRTLLSQDWPGNVRELENVIEHAVTLSRAEQITVDDLPEYLRNSRIPVGLPSRSEHGEKQLSLSRAVSELEARLICWALKESGGNQQKAAELLDIPRTTLRDKLSRLKSDNDEQSST